MAGQPMSRYYFLSLPTNGMVNPVVIHHTLLAQVQGFSAVSRFVSGEDMYNDRGNYLCLVKFCSPVIEDRLADYFDSWYLGLHPNDFKRCLDHLCRVCVPDSIRSFSL